jgi:hypothetical protein
MRLHAEHDERYEVKNADVQRLLRTIGGNIDEDLPDGWGFTLFLYNYGEGGALFYISSAERATMIETVKEWLAKQEKSQ